MNYIIININKLRKIKKLTTNSWATYFAKVYKFVVWNKNSLLGKVVNVMHKIYIFRIQLNCL